MSDTHDRRDWTAVSSDTVRLTDQTLAQQLQITDREIGERKILLMFGSEDERHLADCRPLVMDNLDEIADAFYKELTAHPQVQLLIGDAETFKRLHRSMRRYVIELFEGFYDSEYVNTRLRIGKIHERIGVSPKLYISAINLLESILRDYITKDSALEVSGKEEAVSDRISALHKLLMFDVQLVFDTYIASLVSEVETAKRQVELYAESLEATVAERTRQLEELSRMDGLTGLFNQRSFYEHLRRETARAERHRTQLTLAYFDLNGMKGVNDNLGHKAGDALLELVGKTVREAIRNGDIACRYGGDEFAIIMPRTDPVEARIPIRRLCDVFDAARENGVTFSIGIVTMGPEEFDDMSDFVKRADEAMYTAKTKSREKPGHHIHVDGA